MSCARLHHSNRFPRKAVDPGSVQGQAGWGSEQPVLVEGVLPMAGELELGDL